jgi:hypothetical protein
MAMNGMSEATHLKKGGKVARFAEGGKVMPESKTRTLIRDSRPDPIPHPPAGPSAKVVTHKRGGQVAKPVRKAAARGR